MTAIGRQRRKVGITQDELAARIGLHKTVICRIEGGWLPSYETAERIAAALSCTVADLWAGAELRRTVRIHAPTKGGAA